MKVRQLNIYCVIYGLLLVGLTTYWAANFSRHTTYKGDEFFMLAQYLLVLTYLFFFIIQFTVKRINFLLALGIPLIACVIVFCIGWVFMLATQLSGTPKQYLLIYGLLYGLVSVLAVYKFWGRTLANKKEQ